MGCGTIDDICLRLSIDFVNTIHRYMILFQIISLVHDWYEVGQRPMVLQDSSTAGYSPFTFLQTPCKDIQQLHDDAVPKVSGQVYNLLLASEPSGGSCFSLTTP